MNILAIEASGEACSCALRLADGTLAERFEIAPRRHAERALPMVQSLLDEAGLGLDAVDGFAFGRGPGSFTGVRIATCVAQGLALARGRPVFPVSSLAAAAARGAAGGGRVLAAFDARMGEVYLLACRVGADGGVTALGAEQLAPPGEVALPDGPGWIGVGPGWAAHGHVLGERLGARLGEVRAGALPGAAQVARLAAAQAAAGAGVPPSAARPEYLRRQVTTPRRRAPDG